MIYLGFLSSTQESYFLSLSAPVSFLMFYRYLFTDCYSCVLKTQTSIAIKMPIVILLREASWFCSASINWNQGYFLRSFQTVIRRKNQYYYAAVHCSLKRNYQSLHNKTLINITTLSVCQRKALTLTHTFQVIVVSRRLFQGKEGNNHEYWAAIIKK